MTYTFQPRGVCSRAMTVEVDDQGVIRDLQVVGGCNGNHYPSEGHQLRRQRHLLPRPVCPRTGSGHGAEVSTHL